MMMIIIYKPVNRQLKVNWLTVSIPSLHDSKMIIICFSGCLHLIATTLLHWIWIAAHVLRTCKNFSYFVFLKFCLCIISYGCMQAIFVQLICGISCWNCTTCHYC